MKKMKGLFVVGAIVMSLSLAKNRTSHEVTLNTWPQGPHFYLGEPIVLTCEVEQNSSDVWIYSWFSHDLTSPPASLHVWPDSSQHLKDEQFSLRCSVHDGDAAAWTLRRLHAAEVNSGCLQMEGRVNPKQPDKCNFFNITAGFSGLYWCGAARGDQRSYAINITVSDGHVLLQTPVLPVTAGQTVSLLCKTSYNLNKTLIYKDGVSMNNTNVTIENVTKAHEGFYKCVNPTAAVESPESWLSVRDHSEDKKNFIAAWVWAVCVIFIVLLLSPLIFLLVPSLRKRVKLFPTCGAFNAHQEMPRTKQDVTEIQWDLAWMEMSNLLD